MLMHALSNSRAANAERRIVAVVLKELLCELAQEQQLSVSAEQPQAVILLHSLNDESTQATKLSAVNPAARAFGVRAGQSVAEACAWVAHLAIRKVTGEQVQQALARVAECLLQFSPLVSLAEPDTLWVDITGVAQLFGGEDALLREITASVSALGHFGRSAIAQGPLLAQAFARWGSVGRGEVGIIVPNADSARAVQQLPIQALPVTAEVTQWLGQLGLLHLRDLAQLPAQQLLARLGEQAQLSMDLLQGRDDQPLQAYAPPPLPREQVQWDEPTSGIEPLLFALRRLCARLGARLESRGLAAQTLELVVQHDPAMVRFHKTEATSKLHFEFAAPLFRADDLNRVLLAQLSQLQLPAPCVGLELEVRALVSATQHQLELSPATSKLRVDLQKLSTLFSELAADVGNDRLGTLQIGNSHLPEKLSLLMPMAPVTPSSKDRARGRSKDRKTAGQLGLEAKLSLEDPPNRLLPTAAMIIGPLKKGTLVPLGNQLYSLCELTFKFRLEQVEWWSGKTISRDYLRVGLQNRQGRLDALVYVNRETGESFLQALYD